MDSGYAWVIMICSCLLQLLYSCGLTSFGILLVDINETSNLGVGKLAWIGAILATFCGVGGIIIGPIVGRFGCRPVIIMGSFLISSGYLISALVPFVEIQYVSLGVVAGIGFNCFSVCSHVITAQWFQKYKAFALSFVMLGMSLGMFIWSPLTRFLSNEYNWHGAMFIISALQLNGCVLAFLIKPHQNSQLAKSLIKNIKCYDFSLLQNWMFLIYCISNFCLLFGHVLPLVLLPTKAKTVNLEKWQGAAMVSLMGVCSCIGRPIVGYCADKKWFKRQLAFAITATIGGLFSCISVKITSFAPLMIYSASIGFVSAFFMALFVTVGADLIGIEHIPKGVGLLVAAHGLSFLSSIVISGQLVEFTKLTDASFLLAGLVQVISGILAFIVYFLFSRKKKLDDLRNKLNKEDIDNEMIQLNMDNGEKVKCLNKSED